MATTSVLDGTSVVLDDEGGGDASLDLASHMDIMMSMMVHLSNKVNGLEQDTQGLAAPVSILSAVPLHDPQNTTRQAALPQDPELEEAIWRRVQPCLSPQSMVGLAWTHPKLT